MSIIYIRGFEDKNVDESASVWNGSIGVSNIPGGGWAARTEYGAGGDFRVYVSEMSEDDSPDFSTCYVRIYGKVFSAATDLDKIKWRVIDSNASPIVEVYADGHVYISGVDKGDQGYTITDSWARLEFGIKVNSVSGHVIFKINGTTIYSIYTDLSAHPAVGSLGIADDTAFNSAWMDDIVINDTNGSRNNSWPGSGHVYGLKPNAAGSNADLDAFPGTGESNYQDVDEVPNDGDTTYVQSNADGDLDTYNFEALGSDLIVKGLAVHTITKLVSAGSTGLKTVAKSGANYSKKTTPTQSTSYSRRGAVYEDAPDGAAWTKAKVDAAEFGVEVVV